MGCGDDLGMKHMNTILCTGRLAIGDVNRLYMEKIW